MRNPFVHSSDCTEENANNGLCKDCFLVISSTTAVAISKQGDINDSVCFAHMSTFDTVHKDPSSSFSSWGKNQSLPEGFAPLLNRFYLHDYRKKPNLIQIPCPSSSSIFEVQNVRYWEILDNLNKSIIDDKQPLQNKLVTNRWERRQTMLEILQAAYPTKYYWNKRLNDNSSDAQIQTKRARTDEDGMDNSGEQIQALQTEKIDVDNNEDGMENSGEQIQSKRAKTGEGKKVCYNEDGMDNSGEQIQALLQSEYTEVYSSKMKNKTIKVISFICAGEQKCYRLMFQMLHPQSEFAFLELKTYSITVEGVNTVELREFAFGNIPDAWGYPSGVSKDVNKWFYKQINEVSTFVEIVLNDTDSDKGKSRVDYTCEFALETPVNNISSIRFLIGLKILKELRGFTNVSLNPNIEKYAYANTR